MYVYREDSDLFISIMLMHKSWPEPHPNPILEWNKDYSHLFGSTFNLTGGRPLLSVIEKMNDSKDFLQLSSYPMVHGNGEYPPNIWPSLVWIKVRVGPFSNTSYQN